jgi:AcrR family transcriptional regulator
MVQILNVRSPSSARPGSSDRPGSDRVRRKSEARRLEILHAAARVFRRRGVAAAGMREIADEADLSPGNLYYYFRGKDELLYFCQDRTLEQMHAAVGAARLTAAPVAEQVRAVLSAHLHCTLDEMEGATAHLEVEALPDKLRRQIVEKRDGYERSVRALVSKGMKQGEFAPCDAALVTRAMLGAVNWTARWYRPDGSQSVEHIAKALSEYLVRGLSSAPSGTRSKSKGGSC